MLCCVCKQREARVHLTQIIGDKMHKVDLCEQCAAEKGVNDPTGFGLTDLLVGLGSSQQIEHPGTRHELRCPRCGFTQSDFKKAGRLGCADCYTTFAESLEPLLKSMHRGTRHVGKVPHGSAKVRDLTDKLKILQKRLEKAIAEEDFEQAALLRDEIKATKEKMASLSAAS
jgi:protein arginine kinase activator